MQSEKSNTEESINKFLNKPAGLSKSAYLRLMEHKGQEPDPAKIPIEYEDLSYDAQLAYAIYSKLGNRISGNIGFIGKDYSNLPIFIEIYDIKDKDYLLDLLTMIEIYYINENSKQIEKIMNKNKPKP